MKLTDFKFKEFIKDIERKYGHTVARNMTNNLTRLAVIVQTNDYSNELDSLVRFKLHPITGDLIVETINDQFNGYRYTFTTNKVHRKY